jgi:SAM-dependent methyltransferase
MMRCKVCSNIDNNHYFVAREMMYGSRDEFDYFECSACGCLQIAEIPSNLSKYYPEDYYAFNADKRGESPLKKYLKHRRASHALGRESIIGHLLVRLYGLPDWLHSIKPTKPLDRGGFHQAILDVGSGTGSMLLDMYSAGFSNLTGVDKYIENDIHYENGVVVLKRTLDQLDGTYDLVMLHHSFEHIPDPLATLKRIRSLLRPDRFALLKIPVAQSYAWRVYGVDWVQLDAPRHLFLHTEESIRILARRAGLEVASVIYNSTDFQFWGSEQYKRGIPLMTEESYAVAPSKSIFSKDELRGFRKKAEALNKKGDGDQACFYLRRST